MEKKKIYMMPEVATMLLSEELMHASQPSDRPQVPGAHAPVKREVF